MSLLWDFLCAIQRGYSRFPLGSQKSDKCNFRNKTFGFIFHQDDPRLVLNRIRGALWLPKNIFHLGWSQTFSIVVLIVVSLKKFIYNYRPLFRISIPTAVNYDGNGIWWSSATGLGIFTHMHALCETDRFPFTLSSPLCKLNPGSYKWQKMTERKSVRSVYSRGQGQLDQITPIITDLRAGKHCVSHPSDTVLSLSSNYGDKCGKQHIEI